jgi:hypothetical protein
MKKWFEASVTALVPLVLLVSTANVTADKPPKGEKGGKGQAGQSNVAFIELWEKDADTWGIVEEGAWAKLKYRLEGCTFD